MNILVVYLEKSLLFNSFHDCRLVKISTDNGFFVLFVYPYEGCPVKFLLMSDHFCGAACIQLQ